MGQTWEADNATHWRKLMELWSAASAREQSAPDGEGALSAVKRQIDEFIAQSRSDRMQEPRQLRFTVIETQNGPVAGTRAASSAGQAIASSRIR